MEQANNTNASKEEKLKIARAERERQRKALENLVKNQERVSIEKRRVAELRQKTAAEEEEERRKKEKQLEEAKQTDRKLDEEEKETKSIKKSPPIHPPKATGNGTTTAQTLTRAQKAQAIRDAETKAKLQAQEAGALEDEQKKTFRVTTPLTPTQVEVTEKYIERMREVKEDVLENGVSEDGNRLYPDQLYLPSGQINFAKMGDGKTLMTFKMISDLWAEGWLNRAIIVVPPKLRDQWELQLLMHTNANHPARKKKVLFVLRQSNQLGNMFKFMEERAATGDPFIVVVGMSHFKSNLFPPSVDDHGINTRNSSKSTANSGGFNRDRMDTGEDQDGDEEQGGWNDLLSKDSGSRPRWKDGRDHDHAFNDGGQWEDLMEKGAKMKWKGGPGFVNQTGYIPIEKDGLSTTERLLRLMAGSSTIVVDESTEAKNPETYLARALFAATQRLVGMYTLDFPGFIDPKKLVGTFPPAILALTGWITASRDCMDDFRNVLRIICPTSPLLSSGPFWRSLKAALRHWVIDAGKSQEYTDVFAGKTSETGEKPTFTGPATMRKKLDEEQEGAFKIFKGFFLDKLIVGYKQGHQFDVHVEWKMVYEQVKWPNPDDYEKGTPEYRKSLISLIAYYAVKQFIASQRGLKEAAEKQQQAMEQLKADNGTHSSDWHRKIEGKGLTFSVRAEIQIAMQLLRTLSVNPGALTADRGIWEKMLKTREVKQLMALNQAHADPHSEKRKAIRAAFERDVRKRVLEEKKTFKDGFGQNPTVSPLISPIVNGRGEGEEEDYEDDEEEVDGEVEPDEMADEDMETLLVNADEEGNSLFRREGVSAATKKPTKRRKRGSTNFTRKKKSSKKEEGEEGTEQHVVDMTDSNQFSSVNWTQQMRNKYIPIGIVRAMVHIFEALHKAAKERPDLLGLSSEDLFKMRWEEIFPPDDETPRFKALYDQLIRKEEDRNGFDWYGKPDDKIVIADESPKVLEGLASYLWKKHILSGTRPVCREFPYVTQGNAVFIAGLPPAKLQPLIDKFSNDPDIRIIFISTAHATGFNLDAANKLFILRALWRFHVLIQLCFRLLRIGQKKRVIISCLYNPQGIEWYTVMMCEFARFDLLAAVDHTSPQFGCISGTDPMKALLRDVLFDLTTTSKMNESYLNLIPVPEFFKQQSPLQAGERPVYYSFLEELGNKTSTTAKRTRRSRKGSGEDTGDEKHPPKVTDGDPMDEDEDSKLAHVTVSVKPPASNLSKKRKKSDDEDEEDLSSTAMREKPKYDLGPKRRRT